MEKSNLLYGIPYPNCFFKLKINTIGHLYTFPAVLTSYCNHSNVLLNIKILSSQGKTIDLIDFLGEINIELSYSEIIKNIQIMPFDKELDLYTIEHKIKLNLDEQVS